MLALLTIPRARQDPRFVFLGVLCAPGLLRHLGGSASSRTGQAQTKPVGRRNTPSFSLSPDNGHQFWKYIFTTISPTDSKPLTHHLTPPRHPFYPRFQQVRMLPWNQEEN